MVVPIILGQYKAVRFFFLLSNWNTTLTLQHNLRKIKLKIKNNRKNTCQICSLTQWDNLTWDDLPTDSSRLVDACEQTKMQNNTQWISTSMCAMSTRMRPLDDDRTLRDHLSVRWEYAIMHNVILSVLIAITITIITITIIESTSYFIFARSSNFSEYEGVKTCVIANLAKTEHKFSLWRNESEKIWKYRKWSTILK